MRGAARVGRRHRHLRLHPRSRARASEGRGLKSPARIVHRDLGLTDDEYEAIRERLGREPTYTELAMFSVMWSEHCSYKSSRAHLKNLPTDGPRVLIGPGEGAGVVEVARGLAVAWKVESHNHPSFVEPFNGAATGIGGIVRDILSMGARPIALLDSLRFGTLDDARTRYLVDGVVHGISSYGNSIGVPTVGGEAYFDECYAENPLVNVACLGVIEDRLMQARAERPGHVGVLFGASTGRDGIGGASVLASATFDDESLDKRPSVQVGDPFAEKLLIEASLELIRDGLIVGFQDLGAGGISCPTSEMSSKGETGMRIFADRVHLREPDMETFEVMISESQERMFAIVEPANVANVLAVCAKWGLEARVVAEVKTGGRLEVVRNDETVAEVSARALAEEAPVYQRRKARPAWIDDLQRRPPGDEPPASVSDALLALLASPNVASKRWIFEQYDHMIFLGTVVGPGGDAAVIRLPDSDVAVALTTDGPGRYCYLDPYEGARLAVAEAARNVACTGATPVAVTNCLNFGDPEKPEVMWQFAEAVRGIADACRSFETPVVGGNVSFYNETNDRAIYPTPVIGMLGVLDDARRAVGAAFTRDGDAIVLLGRVDENSFGGSEFARTMHGVVGGRPPTLDAELERALRAVLIEGARRRLFASAHDVSAGGPAVTLAESAIAGGRGFTLQPQQRDHRFWFAESQAVAVISVDLVHVDAVLDLCRSAGIDAHVMGTIGGDTLDFGDFAVSLETARQRFESGFARHLSATMKT